jgi:hypothetical protein
MGPLHGRRWTWRYPFRWICRCGLEAYPCVVEQTWARGDTDPPADGRVYADLHQADERRRRRGAR